MLLLVMALILLWAIGYVVDLNSDSWLLKGSLLLFICIIISLFARYVDLPFLLMLNLFCTKWLLELLVWYTALETWQNPNKARNRLFLQILRFIVYS